MHEGGDLQVLCADFHIHTCLSPCASLDMSPVKIVRQARGRHLKAIAITDHNSVENAPAVMAAARDAGLVVIPGIEVTTEEEAHIVGLFDEIEAALSMQGLVYEHLLQGENDEDLFGIQVVANEWDEVRYINRRLLIGATSLPLEEVISGIHDRGGLAVAAHIDRDAFSVTSQLGFIPLGLNLDALEVSRRMSIKEARERFGEYSRFPFITASDAHDLEEIGVSPLRLYVKGLTMTEIKQALACQGGRRVCRER
ncbi:MAG: PHP domain-containing protein [Pseudomonadota bacterium]